MRSLSVFVNFRQNLLTIEIIENYIFNLGKINNPKSALIEDFINS